MVASSEADLLVVGKLDRLPRWGSDFTTFLDRARAEGWGMIALDLGVDTSTTASEVVADVMAASAQWERRTINDRTKGDSLPSGPWASGSVVRAFCLSRRFN